MEMAEFMNFYSYKLNELLELEFNDYVFLLENMYHVKAKERLHDLQLHVYPHTKSENQNKIHKSLNKMATPQKELEKRAVEQADLTNMFGNSIADIIKDGNGRK